MKKIAIIVAAACMIAGTSAIAAPSKKGAAAAVQAAVNSIESAKSVRGEWRDSYKTLGKAKKAYHKGDYATATKLASKAKRQGTMGKAQAKSEVGIGKKLESMYR